MTAKRKKEMFLRYNEYTIHGVYPFGKKNDLH